MDHVVLWDRLAFQKHVLDENGRPTPVPDGPEEIVTRGGAVPDYVMGWERNALANAGMIVAVGGVVAPAAPAVAVGPVAPAEQAPAEPEAPAPTATRGEWEAYATSDAVGMTAEEAASYPNKQALIDAVTAKLAEN